MLLLFLQDGNFNKKIMKGTLKTVNFLMLMMFAISCNKNMEVEVKEFNSSVTYNTAKGYYWGNYFDSGTANFQLWLYSDTNEEVGILIDGYATLPSNPANFRLDAGTYSVSENESVRTVFPSDEDLEGTYAFNERTSRYILVTGGNFTVEQTSSRSNIYSIETNFTGIEINSNVTVNDIRINFSGQIVFEDMTLSFNDIKQSKYTATGFSQSSNRSISWQGEVFPNEDNIGLYYGITNWHNTANLNLEGPLCLDFVNGKLILDDYISVGEDGDYDLYYKASYSLPSNQNWFYYLDNYHVYYNKSTRTLDFSDTYDGHPVYVGLWGKHYITDEWIVYLNTQVKDAKLVLTPGVKSTQSLTVKNRISSKSTRSSIRFIEDECSKEVKRIRRR